jgi:uncharacterized protein involved in type VI secretion and phage assembly
MRTTGITPSEKEDFASENRKTDTYVGEIVDASDPEQKYRARVRVHGLFDDLDSDAIPWAIPGNATNFSGGGAGNVSYPKEGSRVMVRFFNGDIYHPIYYFNMHLDDNMANEIANPYENSHSILYDSDEELKIYYNNNQGLYFELKGATAVINNDGNITLNHSDSQSTIELVGGDIRITSNATVDVSTQRQATITAQTVHVNGTQTDIGASPIFSAVNGETLMGTLKAIASAVDAKFPPTPGVTASSVNAAEQTILSQTVSTSP